MADLNSLIAQGAQFQQMPDPFANYAKMQQLQQGQQANQLAQMKMQEYQRGVEEQNRLRVLDPNAADYESQLFRVKPELGIAYRKEQAAAAASKAAAAENEAKTTKAHIDNSRELLSGVTSQGGWDAWRADAIRRLPQLADIVPAEFSQKNKDDTLTTASDVSKRLTLPLHFGNTGGQTNVGFNQTTGAQVTPGVAATMTPGQSEANRIAEARMAQSERLANERLAQGERRIGIAEDKANRPPELKQVPIHAQKAIVGAATALTKIDNAIAALESNTGKEATGYKGYLPDVALNRMYPKGAEARAAVADIGSLVMHERSGAAVTASESPRLKPFIPLVTDDKITALKKLKRMRQIQADDAEALAGTYNPEQGFREFKTPSSKGKTTPTDSVDTSNPLLR